MPHIQVKSDDDLQRIDLQDIPKDFVLYGFEFEIDIPKVWALEAPTIDFPIKELLWHMGITPWSYNGKPLAVGPRQVLADPEAYPHQYQKIVDADCSHPLDIAFNNGRWVIVDGLHRLCAQIMQGFNENDVIKARIHSKEALIACMDRKATPAFIAQRYPFSEGKDNSVRSEKGLLPRPEILNALTEPEVFQPEQHLSPSKPERIVKLTEIGYSQEFVNALSCDLAYTSAFPLLTDAGVSALRAVSENMKAQQGDGKNGPLLEFGAAAYISPYMRSMGKSEALCAFLSSMIETPLEPYVRLHFLAALNVGKASEGKKVRRWHNDYQSMNLIVFLDDPLAHKGGKLQLYRGTKEEADTLLKKSDDLPSNKVETITYPKAGHAVLIQGSLLKHAVTPLHDDDPNRHTLVLGYRGADLNKLVIEHTGIAPDHPLCRYPEAVQQAAAIAARRLLDFSRSELYAGDPEAVLQLLDASLNEVNAISLALKSAQRPRM